MLSRNKTTLSILLSFVMLILIPSISCQDVPTNPMMLPPLDHNPTISAELSTLFKRPYRPANCTLAANVLNQRCAIQQPPPAQGCLDAPPELRTSYSAAVDQYVTALYANHSRRNFLSPLVSDFDEHMGSVPADIANKILEISGGDKFCNISMVAEMMRDHPLMNFKFWLRGFHCVVLVRPGLSQNLESDPLAELDTLFESQPPQWLSPRPPMPSQDQDGVEVACGGRHGKSSQKNDDLLWYFREDLGLNKYHATWHAQNPWAKPIQPDRRGELFFYFHRNLLARYNTERITHSIPAIKGLKFANNVTINPGYNPNSQSFVARQPSRMLPRDLPPHEKNTYLSLLSQIRDVENAAVSLFPRHLSNSGSHAADELGHLVESSVKSMDKDRYGAVHNAGHQILGSLVQGPAVITQLHTTLFDPLFYQWHAFVDGIMQKQKSKLPEYQVVGGEFPLSFPEVRVNHVTVTTLTNAGQPNTLHTFWRNRHYEGGQCRKVLDHEDFLFTFNITNTGPNPVYATIRTFLAPSKGSNGKPLTIEEQQNYIFALDVYNAYLTPGDHAVPRPSTWLATTAPRWNDPILQRNKGLAPHQEVLCGCGYPHNLLLPMGNDCVGGNGEEFDLITIITDGSVYPFQYGENPEGQCISPPVLCGVADHKLPYADLVLPMGYPFDGRSLKSFKKMQTLTNAVGNMGLTKIHIQHHDGLLSGGMTWNQLPVSGKPSTNPRCSKGNLNGTTTTTTTTTTTQRPTRYTTARPTRSTTSGSHWNVTTPTYRPTDTTTTAMPGGKCWYDYSGRKQCRPIPPGYTCEEYYGGLNYCREPVTTATTPRAGYTHSHRHTHGYGYHITITTPRPTQNYGNYGYHSTEPTTTQNYGYGYGKKSYSSTTARSTTQNYNYGYGNYGYGSPSYSTTPKPTQNYGNYGYGYNNGYPSSSSTTQNYNHGYGRNYNHGYHQSTTTTPRPPQNYGNYGYGNYNAYPSTTTTPRPTQNYGNYGYGYNNGYPSSTTMTPRPTQNYGNYGYGYNNVHPTTTTQNYNNDNTEWDSSEY